MIEVWYTAHFMQWLLPRANRLVIPTQFTISKTRLGGMSGIRRKAAAAAALWLQSLMGSMMVMPEASAGKGPELEYRLYSFLTKRPTG